MKKTAVDIALLLPQEINDICISLNRDKNADAFSDLSKEDNHPHITLGMGVINDDVEAIGDILKKIGSYFQTVDIEIIDISNKITPENKTSSNFVIKLSDKLKKLHGTIMKEFLPIFSYEVEEQMFFIDSDEKFNEVSKYWVKNYGKKHIHSDNYHPHISLKCRHASYSNFPVDFIASTLAICQLGNYCTCRKIIKTVELQTSPPA